MNKTLRPAFHLAALAAAVILLASCQPSYYYHFPKESEARLIRADSLHWKYVGGVIAQVPVADDAGHLYWLDVTDKTKLLIKSIYGEEYRLNLRSIEISDNDAGLFGPSGVWTGYEVREHVRRSIPAREVDKVTIIAESPATTLIEH